MEHRSGYDERPQRTAVRPLMRLRHANARPMVAVAEGFRHPLAPVANESPPALLPLIGLNDDLTPQLEQTLQPIAVRARAGDWAARDALYAAFEPKVMRFVHKIRVPKAPFGSSSVWERDDVVQEAYLVFVNIIGTWSPEIPFGRYLLANFPWRLRDAVYRGVGKRLVPPRMLRVHADHGTELVDQRSVASEQHAVIDSLATSLESPLDEVFKLHILDKLTMKEIAVRLGVSHRSATRYWHIARLRLRPDMSG